MVKAKSYKEHLLKQLQKPKEAAAYLNAALQGDDQQVFLLALRDIVVTESSGNVFADLGFKNPEEMMAKANLAILIGNAIKKRKLTQKKAAAIMGVDQSKISAILRGRLSGFTIERLMGFFMALEIAFPLNALFINDPSS